MSLYELERDGDVQELIRVLRGSDKERVRHRAAELLGNFPDHHDQREPEQDGPLHTTGGLRARYMTVMSSYRPG